MLIQLKVQFRVLLRTRDSSCQAEGVKINHSLHTACHSVFPRVNAVYLMSEAVIIMIIMIIITISSTKSYWVREGGAFTLHKLYNDPIQLL